MASLLPFYDAGLIRQVATNLFYGWGYNFYRRENQLRADDQLVRAKAVSLLGLAAAAVAQAESAYRREYLPPPSRAKPFPDGAAVAGAQALERVAQAVLAVEARLQALPVPENDRMTQRFRQEAPTLELLIARDEELVGRCEMLRAMLDRQTGGWMLDNLIDLDKGVEAIATTLMQREAVLLGPVR